MHESSIESVAHVIRMESQRLRRLVRDLETAPPRRIEGILRDVAKTGDTLSAGLARIAGFIDAIEGDETTGPVRAPVETDDRLLELGRRIKMATTFGLCECGKVRTDGGGHGRIEATPDAHVIERARQRADAADQ